MASHPTLTHNDRRNRWERIIAAYQSGKSSRAVAEMFGLNDSHVRSIVRRAGVSRRSGPLTRQEFIALRRG